MSGPAAWLLNSFSLTHCHITDWSLTWMRTRNRARWLTEICPEYLSSSKDLLEVTSLVRLLDCSLSCRRYVGCEILTEMYGLSYPQTSSCSDLPEVRSIFSRNLLFLENCESTYCVLSHYLFHFLVINFINSSSAKGRSTLLHQQR